MEENTKFIDIESTARNSKSKFFRSLPLFVIRLIEKLIRQDEMNATINRHRHLDGIPFIDDVLKEWNISINLKGAENLPGKGRYIFVANHPVGAIDALSFLTTISKLAGEVISPSNELLNHIPNLRPLMIGVNVFGTNTKETANKLNALFQSDTQVMIFPAGEVSRRNKGLISDISWQKSFISKSVQFERDVVPVFISGRNSDLFYFTANLRKSLGIKMYIETILLPREMLNQRNQTVNIFIGKPISYALFTRDRSQSAWAQYVKELVYKLPESSKE